MCGITYVRELSYKLAANEISVQEAIGLAPSRESLIDDLKVLGLKSLVNKVTNFGQRKKAVRSRSTKRLATCAPSYNWLD